MYEYKKKGEGATFIFPVCLSYMYTNSYIPGAMNNDLYTKTAFHTSCLFTRNYSTSFYSATGLLAPQIRQAIYGIYGFVRLADEIVDTFSGFSQQELLEQLEEEYQEGRRTGLSLNPVIHAFICVVNRYHIDDSLVRAFLGSMRADLTKKVYHTAEEINRYIYGSADVVGLMCLKVFTDNDPALYERLKKSAMKLGSAFQKINFLRDLKNDTEILDRSYFPGVTRQSFCERDKRHIIAGIEDDLSEAYTGLRQLPTSSRLGVYLAYVYYSKLLEKIKKTPAHTLINKRIRVSDFNKMLLFTRSFLLNKVNLL